MINTVELNYKTIGEGQPIVIMHGLFGSLDNWQTLAKSISEQGYKVITVDLRNHGKSPHVSEMNHDLMAEDVKAFIDQHHLQNCVLVGHSMGGKTAMNVAMKYPNLIRQLVVVDIAPKPYIAHHHTYFKAMQQLDVANLKSRKEATEELAKSIKSEAVLLFIAKNLKRDKEGGFVWKFNLEALYNNYNSLIDGLQTLKVFKKPTLFIGGKLSDYITPADEPEISRLFPNSRIEMIADSGHWVHAEKPQQFKSLLLEFVKQKPNS